MSTVPGLTQGERAPDMVLPAADGTPTRYYAHAGGQPALLVFAGEDAAARITALADGLADAGGVTVHVVGPPSLAGHRLPFPLLQDAEGKVAGVYRTQGAPLLFLLDPNLRVQEALPFDDDDVGDVVATLRDRIPALRWDDAAARTVTTQAPVLVVPDVLSAQQCAALIEVWETQGNVETGVEASAEGRRGEQLSEQLKRRRDHVVEDAERMQHLASTIGRRVMPEVWKAFAYRARRFEGFKIACYEAAERGHFRAHRDNLSPATAHRRFALTLNLNDTFSGGELRFPEYGPELYRPPAGAALLFSCSHLHEVLDVTEGRRFVLLSFLFGDDAGT